MQKNKKIFEVTFPAMGLPPFPTPQTASPAASPSPPAASPALPPAARRRAPRRPPASPGAPHRRGRRGDAAPGVERSELENHHFLYIQYDHFSPPAR